MPDYSVTCAASNTPINDLDKVRFIALARTPRCVRPYEGENLMIYPNDHWAPISLPLEATYDANVGCADLCYEEEWAAKVFLQSLQKCQRGHFLFSPDFYKFQDAAIHGKLALTAVAAWTSETSLPVGSMFLKEDIYQELLAYNECDEDALLEEFVDTLSSHIALHHDTPSLWNNFDALPGIAMRIVDETGIGPSRRGVPIRMRTMLSDIIRGMNSPIDLLDNEVRKNLRLMVQAYKFHEGFRALGQTYGPRLSSPNSHTDRDLISRIHKKATTELLH